MKRDEIVSALGQHLETMTDCPEVVYPNVTTVPSAHPYLIFAVVWGPTTDQRLKGGGEPIRSGSMKISVVTEKGIFATQAERIAGQIEDHFLMGVRPAQGIVVTEPPTVDGDGYPTDTDYRMVVSVPWRTMR